MIRPGTSIRSLKRSVYAGKRSDTQTTITFSTRELGWTAGQLGFSNLQTDEQAALNAVMERMDAILGNIYICLEYNHPYEMFFTVWGSISYDYYWQNTGKWAVGRGITSGTSATAFSPSQPCSRGQIVTFLYRDKKNGL